MGTIGSKTYFFDPSFPIGTSHRVMKYKDGKEFWRNFDMKKFFKETNRVAKFYKK